MLFWIMSLQERNKLPERPRHSNKISGNKSQRYRIQLCVEQKIIKSYLTANFHTRRKFSRISHGRLAYPKGLSSMKMIKIFI